ncbi:MAG: hypothetical protein KGJ59_06460 [Bacteroidota bacterium]|nr:hypothetical protein [Bacteroidota bacterium]
MKPNNILFCALALTAIISGCTTLTLAPVDYSWPLESVMKVSDKGTIEESRYNIVINVKPLFFEESKDSTHVAGITLRVIRDGNGFYYITAPKFKNVYVFASAEGALKLERKIPVSQTGLTSPAMNQRPPFIELLSGKDKPVFLNNNGIQQPASPKGGAR